MLTLPIKCAIQVLTELEAASATGRRTTVGELRATLTMGTYPLADVMKGLKRAGLIDAVANRYFIACDLGKVTLYDLGVAVDRHFAVTPASLADGWSMMHQHKHIASLKFDNQLSAHIKTACERILLGDLFPCHPTAKPRTATSRRQQTPHPQQTKQQGD